MRFNKHSRRTLWILAAIISAIAVASFLSEFLSPRVSAVQPQHTERLSVNDSRPVASAIESLEKRFGRVITYEDPPFVHPDDILDVTNSVRRDLDQYAPGKAPKVLVPRGGELSFEYGENDSVEVVLSHVLSESERVSPSTTFRVEEANGLIHVVPQSVKDVNGETLPIRSLLDTTIQIPAEERTGMQMLEAWQDAVSTNSKQRIIIGMVPINILVRYKDNRGFSSQNARDVLTEILLRSGKKMKLSWRLFYEPGLQQYAINIHRVQ